MTTMPDPGPYETQEQVWEALRRVRHDNADRQAAGYAMLNAACASSDVRTGDYDRRIMNWLAGLELEMCAVFADLIVRANEAGKAGAPGSPAAEWGVRFTMSPGDRVESAVPDENAARDVIANMRDRHPEFCPVLIRRVAARPAGDWEEIPDRADTGGNDG